jgi:hypothetical protein
MPHVGNCYYSVFVQDILGDIYASLKKLLLKNAIKCEGGLGLSGHTLSGRKYLTKMKLPRKCLDFFHLCSFFFLEVVFDIGYLVAESVTVTCGGQRLGPKLIGLAKARL